MKNHWFSSLVIGLLSTLTFACTPPSDAPNSTANPSATGTPTAEAEGHHHEHVAPHGGTLVVLGEEFAHLEVMLDKDSGQLTVYVLDGEAENPVRLPGTPLTFMIDGEKLMLSPVADELTGETEKDSSKYQAMAENLKGKEKFKAVVEKIEVKGTAFEGVEFGFPEGNEGHDEHAHGEEGHEHEGEEHGHEDGDHDHEDGDHDHEDGDHHHEDGDHDHHDEGDHDSLD